MLARLNLRKGLLLVVAVFSVALWSAVAIAWQGARASAQATSALIALSDQRIQPLYDTERLFLSTLINMDNAYINLVKGDEVKSNEYTRRASTALQAARKAFETYRAALPAAAANEPQSQRVSTAYAGYTKVLGLREAALRCLAGRLCRGHRKRRSSRPRIRRHPARGDRAGRDRA